MWGNKTGSALAIGAIAAIGLIGAARAADYSKQKSEIAEIEHAMAAAQTAPDVLKYWDPAVTWDDVVAGEWHGTQTARQHMAAEFAAVKNLKSTFLEINIDADDHLAYAYSIQRDSWTDAHTNKPVDLIVRQTDCYHRVGGKWLMVYQHVSLPIDFATGKAVTGESLAAKTGGF